MSEKENISRTCEEVYEEPTVILLDRKDPLTKWIFICFALGFCMLMASGYLFLMR